MIDPGAPTQWAEASEPEPSRGWRPVILAAAVLAGVGVVVLVMAGRDERLGQPRTPESTPHSRSWTSGYNAVVDLYNAAPQNARVWERVGVSGICTVKTNEAYIQARTSGYQWFVPAQFEGGCVRAVGDAINQYHKDGGV